jgi:4-hydroxyphenylpyruvate dioxygenase
MVLVKGLQQGQAFFQPGDPVAALQRRGVGWPNPLGWRASSSSNTPPPAAGAGPGAGDDGLPPVARHRSREVLLYRQGGMNVIVNAHGRSHRGTDRSAADRRRGAARARRRAAWRRVLDLGAWAVPVKVQVMELNIPAVHGVGGSRLYFVDRWQRVLHLRRRLRAHPHGGPAAAGLAGLHWFGIVQYVGDRTASPTGPSSMARCSASRRCRTSSASASCRARAASWPAPAAASTCS